MTTPIPPYVSFEDKFKNAFQKAKNSRVMKFGVLTLAVGVGAYYGTRKPLQQVSKNVKHMDKTVTEIGQFLVHESDMAAAFQNSQRAAITDLIKENKGFTHFPGVGVLDHSIYESIKR